MQGCLYVVATPIGNLGDLSERARLILQDVDAVLCEDTRVSRRLFDFLGVDKSLFMLHRHNEREVGARMLERLLAGECLALISDAGTPLISDPGVSLVRLAQDSGVRVVPVPGASAAIAALSVSGILCDRFLFFGFLPSKEKARDHALMRFVNFDETVVFYEAPHRVLATVQAMFALYGGGRELVIARELTKRFEEVVRLPLGEALAWLKADENRVRGEFVLLLAPSCEAVVEEEVWQALALDLFKEGLSVRSVGAVLQKHGLAKKKAVYRFLANF